MKKVKYVEKISYKELAVRSGFPKAFRAVGTVCRRNKLPLLFPCHRIIKSDGSTGQYAGGNHMKKQLLLLENNLQL
jgi:methylated-DNA-[protein]-cysteine S-methyltransferase